MRLSKRFLWDLTESESMAEARENRVSDFLNSFSSNHESDSTSEAMDDETEQTGVELTLGLSLNGRFGVDPVPKNTTKLTRTLSIPEHMNPSPHADNSSAVRHMLPNMGNLMRTCSLPVEPEEEVRKRKEMQSLRRMEAKRKRIEKQRKLGLKEYCERKRVVPLPMKFENRVSTKGLCSEKLRNCLQGQLVVVSSQGSASESESQVIEIEGTGDGGPEVRSMEANVRTLLDHMELSGPNNEVEIIRATTLGTKMKNQFNKLAVSDTNDNNRKTKESLARNAILQDMPRVSTKGDDPNGKRIEGVLYRYDQSDEVRIVCVCHGKILSPSEFVKHAGGTDVEQPLKHIVVTPSSAR